MNNAMALARGSRLLEINATVTQRRIKAECTKVIKKYIYYKICAK